VKAQAPAPAPLLHSVVAACSLLGIGRTLLYAKIGAGEIAVVKIGKRTMIADDEIRRVIAAFTRSAA
jgi:hypothetical protein